jgi:propanol-preferring alcohol dehydrogenase
VQRGYEAWQVVAPGAPEGRWLELATLDPPAPGQNQVLVKVLACGVCRTDLHIALGELPPHKERPVPGHEVVGTVEAVGPGVNDAMVGTVVGVPWLGATCGACKYCLSGRENLCRSPTFTGWDVDGGYAQYCVADARFVYEMPGELDPVEAAPLLCSGLIGYRALLRTGLSPGGVLGIYGFGASAHLTAQLAERLGYEILVFSRSERSRDLARSMGIRHVYRLEDPTPKPLEAAIVFAPAGEVVRQALRNLDRGGVVSIAGIYVTAIPPLDYETELFYEREVRTVTANTRADGMSYLALVRNLRIRPRVTLYDFRDAPRALLDLHRGSIEGAGVICLER